MQLSKILENLKYECDNFQDFEIEDIVYDSRKARGGTVFVALCGALSDGHAYVKSAYDNGARVFLVERDIAIGDDAIMIKTENTRAALALISGNFFSHPDRELTVIGVTGTKGKTTVTHILRTVLDHCGIKSGVIGTEGAYFGDKYLPTVNTTPESYETFKLMRLMIDNGCKAVCMEVSSLGLKHHRVDGMHFDTAVFTNLYPDHIGGHEHDSFMEYSYWKKQLFKKCDYAVFNADDAFSAEIEREITCPYSTFSLYEKADISASNIEKIRDGSFFGVGFACQNRGTSFHMKISMPGLFSVYNALAAYAVCTHMGIDNEKIISAIKNAKVKGRNEFVAVPAEFDVIIDYAHNGISMKSVIETVKEYEHSNIITVFGSVGGRAQLRRKEMGLVSGAMADLSIITTDDPNFEEPAEIADEIASYIKTQNGKYAIILDREKAVHYALSKAKKGDFVLILGKGRETAQKVRGERIPYSDHEAVFSYFKMGKEEK